MWLFQIADHFTGAVWRVPSPGNISIYISLSLSLSVSLCLSLSLSLSRARSHTFIRRSR